MFDSNFIQNDFIYQTGWSTLVRMGWRQGSLLGKGIIISQSRKKRARKTKVVLRCSYSRQIMYPRTNISWVNTIFGKPENKSDHIYYCFLLYNSQIGVLYYYSCRTVNIHNWALTSADSTIYFTLYYFFSVANFLFTWIGRRTRYKSIQIQ
jgi:hypothetical protein